VDVSGLTLTTPTDAIYSISMWFVQLDFPGHLQCCYGRVVEMLDAVALDIVLTHSSCSGKVEGGGERKYLPRGIWVGALGNRRSSVQYHPVKSSSIQSPVPSIAPLNVDSLRAVQLYILSIIAPSASRQEILDCQSNLVVRPAGRNVCAIPLALDANAQSIDHFPTHAPHLQPDPFDSTHRF
jgi:hypothetical protein